MCANFIHHQPPEHYRPETYLKHNIRPKAEKNYYEMVAIITAYNSVESQTDLSPCVGAGGNICGLNNVVACPRSIPLGIRVMVDNKEYICKDRMSLKYPNRFDIFFDKDLESALVWGVKKKIVKIYDN